MLRTPAKRGEGPTTKPSENKWSVQWPGIAQGVAGSGDGENSLTEQGSQPAAWHRLPARDRHTNEDEDLYKALLVLRVLQQGLLHVTAMVYM